MSLFEPDEQGIALGMTGPCLVLDEGPTSYSGIERWEVQDNALTLHLSGNAAQSLGAPRLLRVGLSPSAASAAVADALRYLVDDAGPPPAQVTLVE